MAYLDDTPSPPEVFLTSLAMLNPLSTACLRALGGSVKQLLHKATSGELPVQLAAAYITARSTSAGISGAVGIGAAATDVEVHCHVPLRILELFAAQASAINVRVEPEVVNACLQVDGRAGYAAADNVTGNVYASDLEEGNANQAMQQAHMVVTDAPGLQHHQSLANQDLEQPSMYQQAQQHLQAQHQRNPQNQHGYEARQLNGNQGGSTRMLHHERQRLRQQDQVLQGQQQAQRHSVQKHGVQKHGIQMQGVQKQGCVQTVQQRQQEQQQRLQHQRLQGRYALVDDDMDAAGLDDDTMSCSGAADAHYHGLPHGGGPAPAVDGFGVPVAASDAGFELSYVEEEEEGAGEVHQHHEQSHHNQQVAHQQQSNHRQPCQQHAGASWSPVASSYSHAAKAWQDRQPILHQHHQQHMQQWGGQGGPRRLVVGAQQAGKGTRQYQALDSNEMQEYELGLDGDGFEDPGVLPQHMRGAMIGGAGGLPLGDDGGGWDADEALVSDEGWLAGWSVWAWAWIGRLHRDGWQGCRLIGCFGTGNMC